MRDPSSGVMLRPLGPGDAERAAALIRTAFATQPLATDPPSSALRETGGSIAAWIVAGGGACLTREAEIIGLMLWDERDGGLYCGRLAVDPEERGRGHARRLVAAAECEARRRGLPRLHVRIRLALTGNIRLFEACGFREIGRDAHAGHAAPTVALLEKRIDG